MKRGPYQTELEWLFRACESEMGVRSNFDSFVIASKLGAKRSRLDDAGELVNGIQEDLAAEDAMIDALDTRRARSRFAATHKNRVVMAAYRLLPPQHQRVLEAAYEARQLPKGVREAFDELAGVAPITATARAMPGWSWAWLAGAIARHDPRVAQVKKEAEQLFGDALAAYERARKAAG